MGARVSVASASHAGSAGRSGGSGGATRDAAPSAENGFSSQLSAASQQPRTPDAASEPRPEPSTNARTSAQDRPKDAAAASATAANQAKLISSDQAQDAAATVTEADASSIEADLATQEGKAPNKSAGKSRVDDSQSAADATDPATLALLLAASGLQVDARAGQGQHSSPGNADDQAVSAIAGAVAAASMAMTASISQPAGSAVGAAQQGASEATVGNAVAGAAKQTTQVGGESPQLGAATSDSSAPDASVLQNRSSAPASPQPQASPTTAANGLPQMMRALSGATTPSGAVERTVSLPLADRDWGSAVGNQVQWMVNNAIQSATLQVSPEHLGPVEVRIDVQSSQVNVSFTAAHPDTRGALEQSIPQLRAILAGGGLTLGHTTVQQEARSNSQYPHSLARGCAHSSQTVDAIAISPTSGLGLIDEYA